MTRALVPSPGLLLRPRRRISLVLAIGLSLLATPIRPASADSATAKETWEGNPYERGAACFALLLLHPEREPLTVDGVEIMASIIGTDPAFAAAADANHNWAVYPSLRARTVFGLLAEVYSAMRAMQRDPPNVEHANAGCARLQRDYSSRLTPLAR